MTDQNSRKGVLSLMVLIAVIAIGGFIIFGGDEQDPSAIGWDKGVTTIGAEVVYTEGAVELTSNDFDWTRAEEGSVLAEGDSLEVVGEGRAIVNLDDGSVLRLDSNTSITLASLDPNHMIISLINGELYSRVIEADRVFEISAGNVMYESMGTAYSTKHSDSENGVEVYHSTVKVTDESGNEVYVEQGQKYAVEDKILDDISESDVEEDEFIQWNKEKDFDSFENELGIFSKDSDDVESSVESISLVYDGNGRVTWTAVGEAALGYKVVWSKTNAPTFPTRSGDKYKYLSDPDTISSTIYAFDGSGTYFVRVCEYLGGECGVYSNEVSASFTDSTGRDTLEDSTAKEETEDNSEEDKEESEKDTETEASSAVESILVTANGESVSWLADGYSSEGFKVVWSKSSGPTYPTRSGDKYIYLSSSSASSQTLTPFDGSGTYYVRVCEYLGGACGVYSNQVTVMFAEDVAVEDVASISLWSNGGETIGWSVDGYSQMGYKLVWSKNSSPTYPLRSGDKYEYYSNPDTSSGSVYAFDDEGTYYVRVCEYLGGACGVYSNQIEVVLE
ncbi:MAG: FecR domain-containing protein [Candidatus Uhrbacteria bacterium]|nr:FecR domain-containing protein [Candidatus Uhrbacteria bacterium]